MARVLQRCQERQRRTWCWSIPGRPLALWNDSSMRQRWPATAASVCNGTVVGGRSVGRPIPRWHRCGGSANDERRWWCRRRPAAETRPRSTGVGRARRHRRSASARRVVVSVRAAHRRGSGRRGWARAGWPRSPARSPARGCAATRRCAAPTTVRHCSTAMPVMPATNFRHRHRPLSRSVSGDGRCGTGPRTARKPRRPLLSREGRPATGNAGTARPLGCPHQVLARPPASLEEQRDDAVPPRTGAGP
jgi:hypothetical protein